ncbi:MAG TPA: hypothetical protein VGO46_14555 [Gemmatimonadaceae bacterium]|nr:hypothetical protein [Gemmatimonadaceae bacterium]
MSWGGASVLIGVLLLLVLRLAKIRAPLASHFAAQCALWGAGALLWGWYARQDVPLRDFDAAASLARELWIAIALEAGGVVIGLTFAWFGWSFGKRIGGIGTGIGIAAQAGALLFLDLLFVRAIHL